MLSSAISPQWSFFNLKAMVFVVLKWKVWKAQFVWFEENEGGEMGWEPGAHECVCAICNDVFPASFHTVKYRLQAAGSSTFLNTWGLNNHRSLLRIQRERDRADKIYPFTLFKNRCIHPKTTSIILNHLGKMWCIVSTPCKHTQYKIVSSWKLCGSSRAV